MSEKFSCWWHLNLFFSLTVSQWLWDILPWEESWLYACKIHIIHQTQTGVFKFDKTGHGRKMCLLFIVTWPENIYEVIFLKKYMNSFFIMENKHSCVKLWNHLFKWLFELCSLIYWVHRQKFKAFRRDYLYINPLIYTE